MHRVYVFSSCNYMLLGLTQVLNRTGFPIEVIKIEKPEDIYFNSYNYGGNSILFISLPSSKPWVCAVGRYFIWRLEQLKLQCPLYCTLPCFILGDKKQWLSIGPCYKWISERSDPEEIRRTLTKALLCPDVYASSSKNINNLSLRQQYILDATLCGKTVKEISSQLNITERAVLLSRSALIFKLGLHNSHELKCIANVFRKESVP